MCGHTFLYSPPVRAVRELIDSGELGKLYFVSASRVNLGLHQRDVSVIWDLGPHDFSILLYWLGSAPDTIRATGRDSIVPGIADVAFVTMEFASGLIASVELSWLAPSKLRRTVIVGSKRMVVYEDGGAEAIKIYDRGRGLQGSRDVRRVSALLPERRHPLAEAVDRGAAGAAGRGLPAGDPQPGRPEHDLGLALDVVRLAEAAHASLARGGERVAIGGETLDVAGRVMEVIADPVPRRRRGRWRSGRPAREHAAPHVGRDSALRRLLAAGDAVARDARPARWRWSSRDPGDRPPDSVGRRSRFR